jgi:hypothetical protein
VTSDADPSTSAGGRSGPEPRETVVVRPTVRDGGGSPGRTPVVGEPADDASSSASEPEDGSGPAPRRPDRTDEDSAREREPERERGDVVEEALRGGAGGRSEGFVPAAAPLRAPSRNEFDGAAELLAEVQRTEVQRAGAAPSVPGVRRGGAERPRRAGTPDRPARPAATLDVVEAAERSAPQAPADLLDAVVDREEVVPAETLAAVGGPERGPRPRSRGPRPAPESTVGDAPAAGVLDLSRGGLLDEGAPAGNGPAVSGLVRDGAPASVGVVFPEGGRGVPGVLDGVERGLLGALADDVPVEARPPGSADLVAAGPAPGAVVAPSANPLDGAVAALGDVLPAERRVRPRGAPGGPERAGETPADPGAALPAAAVLDRAAEDLGTAGFPGRGSPGAERQLPGGPVPNLLDATAGTLLQGGAGVLDSSAAGLAPGLPAAPNALDVVSSELGRGPGVAALPEGPAPATPLGPAAANPFDAATAGLRAPGAPSRVERRPLAAAPAPARPGDFTNLLEATAFGLESPPPAAPRRTWTADTAVDELIVRLTELPRVNPLELVAAGERPAAALQQLDALLVRTREALADVLADVAGGPAPGPAPAAPAPPVPAPVPAPSPSSPAVRAGAAERERYGEQDGRE